jgi:hypothetical protein
MLRNSEISHRHLNCSLPRGDVIRHEQLEGIRGDLEAQGWCFELFDCASNPELTNDELNQLIDVFARDMEDVFGRDKVERRYIQNGFAGRIPGVPPTTVVAVKVF